MFQCYVDVFVNVLVEKINKNSVLKLYFVNQLLSLYHNSHTHIKMKEIFAKRFKSARLMKGFSLQDLANEIDGKLSRQALHRYEKGEEIGRASCRERV